MSINFTILRDHHDLHNDFCNIPNVSNPTIVVSLNVNSPVSTSSKADPQNSPRSTLTSLPIMYAT